jgi:hypothetical protein
MIRRAGSPLAGDDKGDYGLVVGNILGPAVDPPGVKALEAREVDRGNAVFWRTARLDLRECNGMS